MSEITNEQKYKTVEERIKAFGEYCNKKTGCEYKLHSCDEARCFARWLAIKAEAEDEKIEKCPFCGGNVNEHVAGEHRHMTQLICSCGYGSEWYETKSDAIAAHNRVALAVRAAKESEAANGR